MDGELIGLEVANGVCFGFNSTATRIWELLETPRRVSELRDTLVAEFEVEPATCERQLIGLLRDLEKDGLVEMETLPG